MSITLGNPIIITSGQLSSPITRNTLRVEKFYWHQPSLSSTSSLLLRKHNGTGPLVLQGTCEVSGQSQVFQYNSQPLNVNDLWVECMPTGTLYIHTK